ncbi:MULTISPECIES: hypothetical protein [unclassified Marinimicrobium]|jgi:hypothetical protein|uniref:hypothetical protein n=1 Tax=Marinimicrobium TaxID=359337 RepID=UPI000C44140E|nr:MULTISPECIES: hypothetical protein [unclassified Marinimicrobium]MAN53107.1 hypothetical protein [Marinimicrobium sp.]|tara:strand:+ start:65 stop:703 length:639 start_codon:yes stop_codon:yes gene_type:complete
MGRSKRKAQQKAIMEKHSHPYLDCPVTYGEVSKVLHDLDPGNTCCGHNEGMEDEYDLIARSAVSESGGEHARIGQAVVDELCVSFGSFDGDPGTIEAILYAFRAEEIERILKCRSEKIRSIHAHLFPEDYDFVYDSISDVRDRHKGIDPMSLEYRQKWQLKRRKLELQEELYSRDTMEFVEKLYLRLSWHEVDILLYSKEIDWERLANTMKL